MGRKAVSAFAWNMKHFSFNLMSFYIFNIVVSNISEKVPHVKDMKRIPESFLNHRTNGFNSPLSCYKLGFSLIAETSKTQFNKHLKSK